MPKIPSICHCHGIAKIFSFHWNVTKRFTGMFQFREFRASRVPSRPKWVCVCCTVSSLCAIAMECVRRAGKFTAQSKLHVRLPVLQFVCVLMQATSARECEYSQSDQTKQGTGPWWKLCSNDEREQIFPKEGETIREMNVCDKGNSGCKAEIRAAEWQFHWKLPLCATNMGESKSTYNITASKLCSAKEKKCLQPTGVQ